MHRSSTCITVRMQGCASFLAMKVQKIISSGGLVSLGMPLGHLKSLDHKRRQKMRTLIFSQLYVEMDHRDHSSQSVASDGFAAN